ncbi:DUF3466 family protein [Vibrio ostreicida]|uniref:DUF3466 family protein n=1 Tax=Vibrio ostreicida TaxID=526588 RepID=A0ABT8BUJ0_9VIBR|nr:DUF3466 family protein [Vibrio ostreicida]MDN3610064.1 DUF3466 family protein [Vibrio ostreicida]NPD10066.1 DUF3466 family protein [Vibrio ostreicida]
MIKNTFKLSSISLAVMTCFGANAAIYNVYDYQPVVDSSARTYGTAIAPEMATADCWSTTTCSQTSYNIAFEEQLTEQGFDYREEAPFRYTLGYQLLQEGKTGFETYCSNFLGYNGELCEEWVTNQYTNGYAKESAAFNNSLAYIEGAQIQSSNNNVIVNSLIDANNALGTYYGGTLQNRTAFYADAALDTSTYDQSKVWGKLVTGSNTYYVGSVSKQSTNDTNDYYSYGAVWDGTTLHTIPWVTNAAEDDRSIPQGSARDLATVNSIDYAVGYNADSDQRPVAAVFALSSLGSIPTNFVSRFQNDNGFQSSVLTSINNNGIAIGEVKYATAINKSFANALFYITDPANPNSSYKEFSGSIFFSGANGKAGGINNYDEVVGAIDYDTHKENNGGSPRAQRAFIAPLSTSGKAPLNNTPRYLDDLTNDGIVSSVNNQYRIIDATDINDAGVISGSAYYCSGGYDTTDINSKCNGGIPGAELIRAVKLVPINGATNSDIQARGVSEEKVDRQGGTLGAVALIVLALFGFRRK